jgi:glyoxylase-like metal-dependent hydrolase (beta-lactamase superfamily II)
VESNQPSAVSRQPSGAPRLTLGDFDLTVLSDGEYRLDGGAFFGVVPRVLWEKKSPPDEKHRVRAGLNSLLVRTGEHTVLIETGIGPKLDERMRRIYAHQPELMNSLAAAGVAPDDVDVVINTHLHFDHSGWNTERRSERVVATFPKARYYVQEGEWQHAKLQLERDRISYLSSNYDPLIASGQMTLLHGDQEIVPGVSVRVLPGHTRHMQAVMVESQGRRACYISDLIPTTAHLKPVWVAAFDLFPMESIENKKRVYDEAVPEKWLMVFTHEHETPWAYLESDDAGGIVARPVK